MTLTAVFAALYVVINIVQSFSVGNPTIFGPVQLRIADCLIALAALFGLPVAFGVTVGWFLSNTYSFLGPADIILGPIVNLLAATAVLLLRRRKLLACAAGGLIVGVSVGSYLAVLFSFTPPELLSSLPPVLGMILSLTISSLIAVGIIGYALLVGLSRPNILKPLKSYGLKTVSDG